MKISKAYKIYVIAKKTRLKAVKKIALWCEYKTLSENAEKLKISKWYAHNFSRRFKLKYISEKEKRFSKENIKKMRKTGLTLEEIAKAAGCKKQNIFLRLKG